MLDDLRRLIRLWRRDPLFPLVTVLALGVGIGATCTIFLLANSLLLRPLPVHDPAQLVRIGVTRGGSGFFSVSYPEYLQLADLHDTFRGVLAHQPQQFVVRAAGSPRQRWGEIVSSNYFAVLGLRLERGRAFAPDPAESLEVIVSHRLWQAEFGGAEDVVGRTIVLNGQTLDVIGVAPPQFAGTFVGFGIDFWVPVHLYPRLIPGRERLDRTEDRFLLVVGRLNRAVSRDRARATLAVVAQRIATSTRADAQGPLGLALASANGVHPSIAPVVSTFLTLLIAMSGLLLLIVCANVSGLLVARLVARQSEFAIQAALGCSQFRLFRQLFTESLAAAAVSGIVGVGVAALGVRALTSLAPATGVPLTIATPVDWRVLLFAACLSTFAGVIFSFWPTLSASRAPLVGAIREVGPGGTITRRTARMRTALLVIQVSVGMVLLTLAGLLTRSAVNARGIDPGFDPTNVVVVNLNPDLLGYDRDDSLALFRRIQERLTMLPSVERASFGLFVPLGDRGDQLRVATKPGATLSEGRRTPYNLVSPGYFDVLRIPVLRGRDFTDADDEHGAPVAIVNEAFVSTWWSAANGLGESIFVPDEGGGDTEYRVVGVVKNFKYRTIGESTTPVVFLPLRQRFRGDAIVHVRTRAGAGKATAIVADQLRAVDGELAIEPQLLSSAMEFSLVPIRVASLVVAASGVLALLLVCSGVYGMVAHRVEQRLCEVGIRLALGAPPAGVVRLLLRHVVAITAIGVALGSVASVAAGRLLSGLLYAVSPQDPLVFGSVLVLLVGVTILGAAGPAARAVRVSPASLLRRH